MRWDWSQALSVLSLTCLAQMNFAEDVSPCLGGHSPGWHSVSSACPLCSSGCRAQCDQQAELCSAGIISLFGRGLQRAHLASVLVLAGEAVAKLASGPLQCGKWQQAFEQWLPFSLGKGSWDSSSCAFGPAELWHACRGFCNFLCTLSACFSLSSAFAFVPKRCYCQGKKNQKNFCFLTVSPFDDL